MKTIKLLIIAALFAGMFVFSNSLNAQSKTPGEAKKNPTKVENFAAGRTLSDADLGLLNAVMAEKGKASRGASNAEVTIDNTTYKVGQTLTDEDVVKISKAIAASKNKKKVKNKDKSRGDCNLWCYYLLQDSYGNWYYYYYCCG